TLGHALRELVKLMAPFTPFFAEGLYHALGGAEESVHLENWPTTRSKGALSAEDKALLADMKMIRELAALGLAKRAEAKIKVRQPLASLAVKTKTLKISQELLAILADEVNVKKVVADPAFTSPVALDTAITPELREEGWFREVVRMVQELRADAKLAPKDAVAVSLELPEGIRRAVLTRERAFKADVGAKVVAYNRTTKFDAEATLAIDGETVWISVRKV